MNILGIHIPKLVVVSVLSAAVLIGLITLIVKEVF